MATRNCKHLRKYKVGGIYNTSQGDFKLLEYIPVDIKKGIKNTRGVIRFIDTGYTCNIQLSNIPAGKIKDRRLPTVYNIGYLDTDITIPQRGSSIIRETYDLWCNMLKRCYGGYGRDIRIYNNVTVDKRWHSFKQFLNTIHKVPGYKEWEKDCTMHLDKDKSGSTIYSLSTCEFLTQSENLQLAAYTRWHKN